MYVHMCTQCHSPHLSFITAPGSPQNLTLVNRTCHSITFQWSPPDDTGRLDVTGYDILHNGTPVATITGTVYTLEGLTPDTVHTISVRTRNAIGPIASVLEKTVTAATTCTTRWVEITSTYCIVCMQIHKCGELKLIHFFYCLHSSRKANRNRRVHIRQANTETQ